MALQAYLRIRGSKQGRFKGNSVKSGRMDDWIQVSSFSYGVQAPRDAATGLATGKRQHKPFEFVMEPGPASQQMLHALSTNEVLKDVTIEFVDTNKGGKEYVRQTIRLTDVTISSVRPQALVTHGEIINRQHVRLDGYLDVEMSFHPIDVTHIIGGKSFTDDWEA